MRIMPPKGFYVLRDEILNAKGYKEIVYTTGERGGGGHKYCRCFGSVCLGDPDSVLEWATLLWSCVPTIEEIQQKYTFYASYEDIPQELGCPPLPIEAPKPVKLPKATHPTKIRKEDVVEGLRVVIVDVMKGLSNYGFFLQGTIMDQLVNIGLQAEGEDNSTILKNGQHLVVTRKTHSRSGRGSYVTVRCEESGATGDIYLCDLTQKCQKIV